VPIANPYFNPAKYDPDKIGVPHKKKLKKKKAATATKEIQTEKKAPDEAKKKSYAKFT